MFISGFHSRGGKFLVPKFKGGRQSIPREASIPPPFPNYTVPVVLLTVLSNIVK